MYFHCTNPIDPQIIVPLTWPDGTYGLPKPSDGCPSEFSWNEGYRYHDTEDNYSNNQWSDILHLDGSWSKNDMRHYFCMKNISTVDPDTQWTWMPGSYCIYKHGSCPSGIYYYICYYVDYDINFRNMHDKLTRQRRILDLEIEGAQTAI